MRQTASAASVKTGKMDEVAFGCGDGLGVALGGRGEGISVGVDGAAAGGSVAVVASAVGALNGRRSVVPAKLHPARTIAKSNRKLKLFFIVITPSNRKITLWRTNRTSELCRICVEPIKACLCQQFYLSIAFCSYFSSNPLVLGEIGYTMEVMENSTVLIQ